MSLVRTYAKKIAAERGSMSQEMIRQMKNAKSHANTQAAKDQRRAIAEQKNADWRSLTPAEQLYELDRRPGNSAKQRKKIAKRLEVKE